MDEKLKEVAAQIEVLLQTNGLRMVVNQTIGLAPNEIPPVPVPEPVPTDPTVVAPEVSPDSIQSPESTPVE